MQWDLKIIDGPDAGASHRLEPGETLVGRSNEARVRLSSPSVSWEHLVISFSQNSLDAQNLSASGTLINGQRIVGKTKLHDGDKLQLAEGVVLTVDRLDGQTGNLALKWLIVLLIVAMVGVIALFLMPDEQSSGPTRNWDRAYAQLDAWLAGQTGQQHLPAVARELLEDGWRHEKSADYRGATRAFGKLQLLLLARPEFAAADEADTDALEKLLSGEERRLTDKTAQAAIVQFARRSLRFDKKLATEPE